MRMLLRSLARNESTVAGNDTLVKDIEEYENGDELIQSTIEKLSLQKHEIVSCNTADVYKKYGIDLYAFRELRFTQRKNEEIGGEKMKELVVATTNQNKVDRIRKLLKGLNYNIVSLKEASKTNLFLISLSFNHLSRILIIGLLNLATLSKVFSGW